MRLWRIYFGIALGGVLLLVGVIALTELKGADDFGILLLTEYWIALCVIVGLILLVSRAIWRLTARFVKPS
jgi:uncharacterized membrane protein